MDVLRLKEVRKKAKMTQKDVAMTIGVTQSGYSNWEKGKRSPNATQIMQLCNIFSCTPNDLFGIHGAMSVAFDPLFEDEKK